MKVISIKQPWASLIINGYKTYEFRSWQTKYRGRLLIHASKTVDKKNINIFNEYNLSYPVGEIIGEISLNDCILVTEDLEHNLVKINSKVYGQTVNRQGYAWQISKPIKYQSPIKISGKLGIWEYPSKIDNML